MRGPACFVLLAVLLGCRGARLDDRTGPPTLPGTRLEKVVDLDYPPGNIAVSPSGRVFFTLHPGRTPPNQRLGRAAARPGPSPNEPSQPREGDPPAFAPVLPLPIDQRGRLGALASPRSGRGQPRLFGFDLASNKL